MLVEGSISTCLLWKFPTSTPKCTCITSFHGVFWFFSWIYHILLGIILFPNCIMLLTLNFHKRFPSHYDCHFTEHRCWKIWDTELYQVWSFLLTLFVHFLKFVLLYFDYISYPSLLLSLISFSQSSSSKASLWPTVSFTERMLLLETKLIGYIVRPNFSLFIFVFPFFSL